ncbi:pyrimidine 5'-nucleotidase [Aliiglaciecola sp. CAU 1673]|uniref:pyrimidine 5'-nucleotidase n=1 Tax=Aliiglaciecola sp. CAU 1673 TaxID=3032595 RepID=UPI0023DB1266|nr:pyrimidine 5'-nucleotidase [Aliiglaciecola sp. CAU 1673]MDF2178381.1 pyrimidine 5'-nucleotidase [Aliiglaciecola sp. CAU 1673]
MKYQCILFDADETLFHFDAYRGLQRMFASFEHAFDEQEFARYQQLNLPLWKDYEAGRISATELQHKRFEPWAAKLGVCPSHLNGSFIQAMADICELLPGARELLDALHGKVQLGIITNGFTALQQERLNRTGVQDRFAHLVISEQLGVAKPDARIFEHALSRMDNPEKSAVLMVGDNLHTDILGGLRYGIDTCWLNRHGQQRIEGIDPHHEVSCLTELQALLQA